MSENTEMCSWCEKKNCDVDECLLSLLESFDIHQQEEEEEKTEEKLENPFDDDLNKSGDDAFFCICRDTNPPGKEIICPADDHDCNCIDDVGDRPCLYNGIHPCVCPFHRHSDRCLRFDERPWHKSLPDRQMKILIHAMVTTMNTDDKSIMEWKILLTIKSMITPLFTY